MTVEAVDLSVRYGARTALDALSFTARPGELLAVIGPNGSGKSSLVRAIAGLQRFSGSLRFGGGAPRIGYMPQDISTRAALTVLETALLGRLGRLGLRVGPADLEAVRDILVALGIEDLAPRYLDELSGGQRQMVFLAQALAAEPQVLLLDEPISALDVRHQFDVLDRVRALTIERGLVTLCVLHDLNVAARYADHILALKAGRLQSSGTARVVMTAARISDLFGVEALVQEADGRPLVTLLRAC